MVTPVLLAQSPALECQFRSPRAQHPGRSQLSTTPEAHVAAVEHFDGRDDLSEYRVPPPPGYPVGGPRPRDIDAHAPLGMRFGMVRVMRRAIWGFAAANVVLLALTIGIGTLSIIPGRATPLQGGIHLVVLGAYLELAVVP